MASKMKLPPPKGFDTRPAGPVDHFGNVVLKGEKKPKPMRGGGSMNEKLLKSDEKAKAAAQAAEARISAEEARRKVTRIDAFEGIFDFLALDILCDVSWDGRMYKSAAHAILAAQYPKAVLDIEDAETLEAARQAAKEEAAADDWSSLRVKAMEKILRDKFRRSPDFRKRLQETGDRELVWETEDDAFWGVIKGKGQNQVGRLLTEIRESIGNDTEFMTWLFLCCEMEDDKFRRPPVELLERKETDDGAQTKVHRLNDSSYFKMGKIPSNAVQALHPSVSREHAMLIHTKSYVAKRVGGVALIDLGSKAGTSISGRKIQHAFVMEPIRNGDSIKLGASTREYVFKVNLQSQIQQLEQQERDLLREVNTIDADAADPVEAAKRAAREEATVFVGNLDFETEKAELLGLFQDCGHVEEIRFPGQEATKASRGIAFVVFDSAMAARRACGLNGEQFKARKVKVAPATENRPHVAGGDGDGSGKGKGKGKSKGKDKDKSRDDGKGLGGSRDIARERDNDRRDRRRDRNDASPPRRRQRSASGERSRSRPRERRKDEVKHKSRSRSPKRRPQRQRSESSDSSSSSSSEAKKKKAAKKKKKDTG